jgi:hypothetical protein
MNIGVPVIRAICETFDMSLSLFRESIIALVSLKFATSSKIRSREIFQCFPKLVYLITIYWNEILIELLRLYRLFALPFMADNVYYTQTKFKSCQ